MIGCRKKESLLIVFKESIVGLLALITFFSGLFVLLVLYVTMVECVLVVSGYRNEEFIATNKVDLHGLHVEEAIEVLGAMLYQRETGESRKFTSGGSVKQKGP